MTFVLPFITSFCRFCRVKNTLKATSDKTFFVLNKVVKKQSNLYFLICSMCPYWRDIASHPAIGRIGKALLLMKNFFIKNMGKGLNLCWSNIVGLFLSIHYTECDGESSQ